MIFSLNGILTAKNGLQVILEVAGVGYGVLAPMSTILKLPELNGQVYLYTHLVVREDAQILYGFLTIKEKFLFCELIKISGLGGKLALIILSHLNVEQFFQVIQTKNLNALINIPGVGKKIAQRLMTEMQNNLNHKKIKELFEIDDLNAKAIVGMIPDNVVSDVQEALISLGYKPKEAMLAIKHIVDNNQINIDDSSEWLLRATLKKLSKV